MDQEGLGSGRAEVGKDEAIGTAPADNLHLAFEDADLVAQHQQLGLIRRRGRGGVRGRGR